MTDLSKLSKKELLEQLQKVENEKSFISMSESEKEMRKLNAMSNDNNPNRIPFSLKNDHKAIYLYTPLNKRIGKLHPDNAKKVMSDWGAKGYPLYTTPRTEEQVAEFKKTDFYKKEHAKHLALRASRKKQSKKTSVEEMGQALGIAIKDAVATK